ncbi:MAG: cyanophycin synthetase, partial [Deltaproteobacteria bacterium]|nr:cyanophycin synthetase [Deltaproteobacteria bacterium]
VVKPQKGNQGKGVSVGLRGDAAVRAAYAVAARRDGLVLLEQHVEGDDYRLLVVGDELVAAARRDPPRVVGDGRLAIHELVERENQDPRRGDDHATSLSKLLLDSIALECLAEGGRDATTVPAAGEVVLLRRNANLSTGGSALDVTDDVHPEVARAAVRAARVVGLDVAGIDVVAPDLTRPLEESGGAIVEVNAAPGLRMHLDPSAGKPRAVGEAIVASMFAAGDQARVPVVAVTGTNGKTTTARAIAHVLAARGAGVGLTCTDGIYVRGGRIDSGDCSGPRSARLVLGHPEVDVAVLETARGGILREGLGFDRCDVAVVTNIGEGDHLGMGGVATAEDLARVKGVIVRAVSPGGTAVLNASDPLVTALAPTCPGEILFFSRDPAAPVLVRHVVAGGRAVTVRSGAIVLIGAGREEFVAELPALPLTFGGRIGFQIENLLASVGALAALGVAAVEIAAGLRTFESTMAAAPGRFNVLSHGEATVILDYGHNASALLALTEAVGQFPHRRRKIVYTAAGDRRDEDIRRQAELVAQAFDEIWVYEDQCTRGRAAGEILGLMGEGFARVGIRGSVHRAAGEFDAIDSALSGLAAGDLLLCQVDQVDEALGFVASRVRQRA